MINVDMYLLVTALYIEMSRSLASSLITNYMTYLRPSNIASFITKHILSTFLYLFWHHATYHNKPVLWQRPYFLLIT